MDAQLLSVLVCPVCKGKLEYDRESQELISRAENLAYPIRDGVPVLLVSEARELNTPPQQQTAPPPAGGQTAERPPQP